MGWPPVPLTSSQRSQRMRPDGVGDKVTVITRLVTVPACLGHHGEAGAPMLRRPHGPTKRLRVSADSFDLGDQSHLVPDQAAVP